MFLKLKFSGTLLTQRGVLLSLLQEKGKEEPFSIFIGLKGSHQTRFHCSHINTAHRLWYVIFLMCAILFFVAIKHLNMINDLIV